jgi:hypothetical protein
MEIWQKYLIIIFGISSLYLAIRGFNECFRKKNAYGLVRILFPWGIIAWGDAVIFGTFWFAVSVIVFILNDWILFLLIYSVFWVVRSSGETIYWFNQQFSAVNKNPPEQYWFYKYFRNDSVWYIHQIAWQCITVTSIIFSIYFASHWLK